MLWTTACLHRGMEERDMGKVVVSNHAVVFYVQNENIEKKIIVDC